MKNRFFSLALLLPFTMIIFCNAMNKGSSSKTCPAIDSVAITAYNNQSITQLMKILVFMDTYKVGSQFCKSHPVPELMKALYPTDDSASASSFFVDKPIKHEDTIPALIMPKRKGSLLI